MAGYSKLYCMGGEGGFMGVDGINPIGFFILVGEGNRQWLEVHYVDKKITPIGNVKVIIPKAPELPQSLLDACIVFFPRHFKSCPSISKVVLEIAFEEIQKSPNYDSGFALRFPRFIRIRDDKDPQEADTIQRIGRVYSQQMKRL